MAAKRISTVFLSIGLAVAGFRLSDSDSNTA
jgi:hypothetical protein